MRIFFVLLSLLFAAPACAQGYGAIAGTGGNGSGGGTVTTVSVVTANGVSGSVSNPTTTPAITLTLGAITPSSVAATGVVEAQSTANSGTIASNSLYTLGGLGVTKNVNLPLGSSSTLGNLLFGGTLGLTVDASANTFGGGAAVNWGNVSGSNNIGFGANALAALTSGNGNVALGVGALSSVTTTNYNFGLGQGAGQHITTGQDNVAIGFNTVAGNGGLTAQSYNVGIGYSSLAAVTGGYNVGIGYAALLQLTSGTNNTAVGYTAGSGYTGTEANNLVFNCAGTAAESNTIQFCDGNPTLRLDYGHTTASTWTIAGATTLTNATIKMPNLANAAANEIVCFASASGLLTYENSVAGCVPSARRLKDQIALIDPASALTALNTLTPAIYTYKDKKAFGPQAYDGLYADQVCGMDERLCIRGKDGDVENYDKWGTIAYLVAALKAQQVEIERLKAR